MKFSILIPTYNGEKVIGDTIKSILSQDFRNFEIIIQDDNSTDNTLKVVKSIKDERIKIYKNKKNVGYAKNLELGKDKVQGEILFLMGQDDILGKEALENTYHAFLKSKEIGAVARPYYWFDSDINRPVRATKQMDPTKDTVVRITDNFDKIILIIDVAGQLSGLAMRKEFMDVPFHKDVFPCHVYPFASIFKKHPVVFLKDYNVAVRIATSQSRLQPKIYEKSPLLSWVHFFHNIFPEKKFNSLRNYCLDRYVASNYVGLLQIRNYSRYFYLWREIFYLLKYRWRNIYNGKFWIYSLLAIITPRIFLSKLVDWYKREINSQKIPRINFEYKL